VIPSDSDEHVSKARAPTDEPQRTYSLFSRTDTCRIGRLLQRAAIKESKKAGTAPDRIQGKAQVLVESENTTDAALNAGGSSVYLWEGTHRYRLFLRKPVEVVHGKEYIAEGVYAQKAIEEIGDPDQGKNGYPLPSSCERVVRMAWSGLSFDELDSTASLVRAG